MIYRRITTSVILIFYSLSGSVTITSGIDEGKDCFIVTTCMGIYYYQKTAGAFSSILDNNHIDWIDYKKKTGSTASGELRGLPTLSYSEGIGHPGFENCVSTQLGDTAIRTITNDKQWEWIWYFSECRATMVLKKIKTGSSYSFMFNGHPNGKYAAGSYWGNDSAVMQETPVAVKKDTVGQWAVAYFGDRSCNRIFFVAQQTPDSIPDMLKWQSGSNNDGMASFAFGMDRSGKPLLNRTDAVFTIGFLEQQALDSMTHAQFVHAYSLIRPPEKMKPLYGISVSAHWQLQGNDVIGGLGNIIRHDIENDSVVNHMPLYTLENAFFPVINQEGTQVAFSVKSPDNPSLRLAVIDIDGKNFKFLTPPSFPASVDFIDWPQGRWVYFNDAVAPKSAIYRAHADDDAVERVMTFKDDNNTDTHPWAWSMNSAGTRMVFRANNFFIFFCKVPPAFPEIIKLEVKGGKYNSPGSFSGCQHNISSSGELICFGPPGDKHNTIRIKQWWDTTPEGCLFYFTPSVLHSWKPSRYNAGGEFQYNRWANNSEEWICANECLSGPKYKVGNQVLYNFHQQKQILVTQNKGDLAFSDNGGDLHVDSSFEYNLPVIRMEKYRILFSVDSGIVSDKDTASVTVTNCGGNILDAVSTRIIYRNDTAVQWLSLKNSGTGNTQIISNKIDPHSLGGGIYRAYVSVIAPNTSLGRVYEVVLTVNTKKIFSKVRLSPKQATVETGKSFLFTAAAFDQYEDTIHLPASAWKWSTDSNATVLNGTFLSKMEKPTPYRVTASASDGTTTHADTAFAYVTQQILHLSMPNGGETYSIGGTMDVRWTCLDTAKINSIAVDLSLDNGRIWYTVNTIAIAPQDTNWGHFQWWIPPTIISNGSTVAVKSGTCLIKIRDYINPQLYRDISDACFTITDNTTQNGVDQYDTRIEPCVIRQSGRTLAVQLTRRQRYTVALFSPNGRLVICCRQKGPSTYFPDMRNKSAGVYILRVQAGTTPIMKRIIIY